MADRAYFVRAFSADRAYHFGKDEVCGSCLSHLSSIREDVDDLRSTARHRKPEPAAASGTVDSRSEDKVRIAALPG